MPNFQGIGFTWARSYTAADLGFNFRGSAK